MKKIWCMALALVLLACLTASAQAEEARIILYTVYQQQGWGDLLQVGCVDENGGLWGIEGYAGELGWPDGWEDQIAWLARQPKEKIGEIKGEELFNLKGLIACAEQGEGGVRGWMNDAGTETSYAVRYDGNGRAETVLLGVTGDGLYENTDPNAQALYRKLREQFPFVRCYAGMADAWGFRPTPLRAFLGMEGVSVRGARVEIRYNDCEAGMMETEASAEDQALALTLLRYGWVTGKANAAMVTGGTYSIGFVNEAGETVCCFEMYRDLLTAPDGMYYLETRLDAPTDSQALSVGIGGREYILGRSTARDLINAGWTWEQEADGVFCFGETEENSWFYVETEGGAPDGAILSVNLMWSDGIPYSYCGYDDAAEKNLWGWLKDDLGGTENEDGLIVAYLNLSDGGVVRVETHDDRPMLTLIR